jgi:hypothetical protein
MAVADDDVTDHHYDEPDDHDEPDDDDHYDYDHYDVVTAAAET